MNASTVLDDRPDAELIRQVLDGDEPAFRTLYRRHTPKLRMVLLRLLGPRAQEVDDLLQESWAAGCRGLARFRGDAQFSTWLIAIGLRTARHRLNTRFHEVELGEHLAPAPPIAAATVIDLERAIATLPDHQRVVLVLHDIEGFTHEEIASQLGVAVGTSKGTLSRARSALRVRLHDGVAYAS